MSYYSNFYNRFPPNHTFQTGRPFFVPPPPAPPTYFIPPQSLRNTEISDQEFVKKFSRIPYKSAKCKTFFTVSINEVKEKLRKLVLTLNNIKEKEKNLEENISTFSEAEWKETLAEIEKNKAEITASMTNINDSYLDMLRKLLAKRSAKRLRLKRLRVERKKEKEQRIRTLNEKSRKIDENLQKIKDDINKAKQEEEAKLKADIVLKEVLRKKHDAKKCISKLDAMLKLYKARQNTAKGRGEAVSEKNSESFCSNCDKLKSLWAQKLVIYEKEEAMLRATLSQDDGDNETNKNNKVLKNLKQWREFLFGDDVTPQADFQGDIGTFVAVRSQWDQYINEAGTSLPVGWVLPNIKTSIVE